MDGRILLATSRVLRVQLAFERWVMFLTHLRYLWGRDWEDWISCEAPPGRHPWTLMDLWLSFGRRMLASTRAAETRGRQLKKQRYELRQISRQTC